MVALLATFYQLYLQRVHNEKSLKPLGQIVLEDRKQAIAVHIRNNGLGPLIIDEIRFDKAGQSYAQIDRCLTLDQKSYMHISSQDVVKRVVLPNASLTVFEDQLKGNESEEELARIRQELSLLSMTVKFRDIYDKRMRIKRDFQWFSRHNLAIRI